MRFTGRGQMNGMLPPLRRGAAWLAAVWCAIVVASCSNPLYVYRYKLTLELDVDGEVRRGSNVVEVAIRQNWFPEGYVAIGATGEALVLELGAGRPVLVALLSGRYYNSLPPPNYQWADQHPTRLLANLYREQTKWTRGWGFLASTEGVNDGLERLSRRRGAQVIAPYDLPLLVAFPDVSEPTSAVEVDPFDLSPALGPGVAWRRITIEVTDEPLTRGIEGKLRWLQRLEPESLTLDGQRNTKNNSLQNRIRSHDFVLGRN